MMRKLLAIVLCLLVCVLFVPASFAESPVSVRVEPLELVEGDYATFWISVRNSSSPSVGSMPKVDGINWLGGRSSSSRMTSVNGKVEITSEIGYSFTVTKSGEIKIPPVEVRIGKKTHRTKPVTLSVQKESQVDLKPSASASGSPMFIRLSFSGDCANRSFFYEGEDVPMSVELFVKNGYGIADVGNFVIRTDPEKCGTVDFPNQKYSQTQKRINGEAYRVLRGVATFRPVSAGMCLISSSAQVVLQTSDGFFLENLPPKVFRAHTEKFTVKALPPVPAGSYFTGLIGENLHLDCRISDGPYRVGETVTLTIRASGNCNMERFRFQTPSVDRFRIYPPEIERDAAQKQASVSLSMIPLEPGKTDFKMNLSAFDVKTGKYVEFPLEREMAVAPGASGVSAAQPLQRSDTPPDAEKTPSAPSSGILYLHSEDSSPVLKLPLWKNAVGKGLAIIGVGLLILIGSAVFSIVRGVRRNDPGYARRKAAAARRGELLRKLSEMTEDGPDPETAALLREYLNAISDLPEGTSLQETADALEKRSPHLSAMLREIASSLWVPGGKKQDADFYKRLVRLVSKLSVILIVFCTAFSAMAQDSEADARTAYDSGRFRDALKWYMHRLDEKGPSAATLYNIGNCFYQLNDLPRALVFYERATSLAPRDADIRENRDFVRRKLYLEVEQESFSSFLHRVCFAFRPDEWLLTGAFGLALCFAGIGFVLLFRRRILYVLCGIGVLLIVLSIPAAIVTGRPDHTGIVLKQDSPVYSLPSDLSGRVGSRLNEGAEVSIMERRSGWVRVQFGDAKNEGWMPAEAVMPCQME